MIRRPRRVVPATVLAVLVLAAMVVLIWSIVQLLLGQVPLVSFALLDQVGAGLAWNTLPVLIAGGVLAVLGLVLLLCAWTPGTPNVLALTDLGEQIQAGATRRSIRDAVVAAARRVDGVAVAHAKVARTRIRTTVVTDLRDTRELAEQVRAAVGAELADISLRRAPRVSVRANRRNA